MALRTVRANVALVGSVFENVWSGLEAERNLSRRNARMRLRETERKGQGTADLP